MVCGIFMRFNLKDWHISEAGSYVAVELGVVFW